MFRTRNVSDFRGIPSLEYLHRLNWAVSLIGKSKPFEDLVSTQTVSYTGDFLIRDV
jgi:hypothetical protein